MSFFVISKPLCAIKLHMQTFESKRARKILLFLTWRLSSCVVWENHEKISWRYTRINCQCKRIYFSQPFCWIWRPLHTESEDFVQNFRTLKNKYDLTLCQSRLHTASETFVIKKIRISFDFLRFRIRSMHFDRKGWQIRKNGKTHAKISDSVCKDLQNETGWVFFWYCIFKIYKLPLLRLAYWQPLHKLWMCAKETKKNVSMTPFNPRWSTKMHKNFFNLLLLKWLFLLLYL